MLVGVRTWQVEVNGCSITISTSASDKRVGPFNDFGFSMFGPTDTVTVWDTYLNNLANAHKGECSIKKTPAHSVYTPPNLSGPKGEWNSQFMN